ncbi:hypothetical protein [Nocardiopsis sp. JB363]|uniref:hypothetical protein n=1 Tax=Nocardiopsis sp. JB363 TaxID=1434837 RepID=UPI00117C776B|nr:hypothetical protein [Nocardiopsis sp. JB363]
MATRLDEGVKAEAEAIVKRAPEGMLATVSTFLTTVRRQGLSTALTDLEWQARGREGAASHALNAGVSYRIGRRVAELNEPPSAQAVLIWLAVADSQKHELATRHAVLLAEQVSERIRNAH